MTSKILACFFLLFTVTFSFAQTQQFTATAKVEDPPYGLVAQLWNNSTSTIYLDHIDVTAAPELKQVATGGILQFGIGFSNVEESQCNAAPMLLLDPVNGPQFSTDTTVRVSQQPCTPNGLTYGVLLSPGKWNYTPTNIFTLASCWGLVCTVDYPSGLAVPPNHGVTIYTGYYVESYAYGWKGYAAVNFRGRK